MHRRKIIFRVADLANARPFRIPTVRPVVTMRRFRKTIHRPFAAVEKVEHHGTNVPSQRPQLFFASLASVDSVRTRRLGELRTTHDFPALIGAFPRPLREASGRNRGVFSRRRRIFAVVRIDKATLRHVPALAMIAGENVFRRRLCAAVPVFADNARFERVDVDFV